MTGFFEELSEVIMQVIIRPASIDSPPLRIGSVDGGYAARALARYAATYVAELLLILTQQFIHRNTQRPRHRRRQPRRNVARLAFIERERVLWNAERLSQLRL
jgi:hypothetical protein